MIVSNTSNIQQNEKNLIFDVVSVVVFCYIPSLTMLERLFEKIGSFVFFPLETGTNWPISSKKFPAWSMKDNRKTTNTT